MPASKSPLSEELATRTLLTELSSRLESPPPSYNENSRKEDDCLKKVKDCLINFCYRFPDHPSNINHVESIDINTSNYLVIIALNEYEIEKFVCTTLRSTLLPYPELYNAETCARFLSRFLEYLPILQPAEERFSSQLTEKVTIRSLNLVLQTFSASYIEFAMILASFLLGAGYDAFVVYGTAPRWICEHDTKCLQFPNSLAGEFENCKDGKENEKCTSENKKETKQKEPSCKHYSNEQKEYIHAWVLVRAGKRNVKEMAFIEPTTGMRYSCSTCPYFTVRSIWSTNTYYINMQRDCQNIKDISFDIFDKDKWEPLFKEQEIFYERASPSEAYINNSDMSRGFEVPNSWIEKLSLSKKSFDLKYAPKGSRVILYNKFKVELFSSVFNHPQGLTCRIIEFSDEGEEDQLHPKKINEYFHSNRKDHLCKRIIFPYEMIHHEYFSPSRVSFVKEWTEILGKKRIIDFYSNSRLDKLIRREEVFESSIKDYYNDQRCDNLYLREILVRPVAVQRADMKAGRNITRHILTGGEAAGYNHLFIYKIIDHFRCIDQRLAIVDKNGSDSNFSMATHDYDKNTVEIEFHPLKDQLKKKVMILEHSSKNTSHHTSATNTTTMSNQKTQEKVQQQMINHEKLGLETIHSLHQEFIDFINMRKREESKVLFDKPILEIAHERNEAAALDKEQKSKKEYDESIYENPNNDAKELDILAPYLTHLFDADISNSLTKEEAIRVKESCLQTLKDRLIERANIIQNRISVEKTKLAGLQDAYQNGRLKSADTGIVITEEEFEKICNESLFRMKILDKRLVRHEETVSDKLKALQEKILSDPRMKVLVE